MDISNFSSSASLPQGFSVYQAALGSPLQFFPAVGTQELDDLLNAYLPGPAHIADKRAAVSVDFLEHLHLTGQSFKFYQLPTNVATTPAPATTSAASSPLMDSGASTTSSFPATPSWDFSSLAPVASSSSSAASANQSSARSGKSGRSGSGASRQPTTDFSHLPGMKIMTMTGIDVTNSASRGSKSKEQRDHAHLMRIIKACDACRAKKVRCDPSHKRRSATTASASSSPSQAQALSNSRHAKKTRTARRPAPTLPAPTAPSPSTAVAPMASFTPDHLSFPSEFSWADFDTTVALNGLDEFDAFLNMSGESSDTFMDHQQTLAEADDLSLFLDPSIYSQPESSFTGSSSASPSQSQPSISSLSPLESFDSYDGEVLNTGGDHRTDLHDSWVSETLLATEGSEVASPVDRGALSSWGDDNVDVVGAYGNSVPGSAVNALSSRVDDGVQVVVDNGNLVPRGAVVATLSPEDDGVRRAVSRANLLVPSPAMDTALSALDSTDPFEREGPEREDRVDPGKALLQGGVAELSTDRPQSADLPVDISTEAGVLASSSSATVDVIDQPITALTTVQQNARAVLIDETSGLAARRIGPDETKHGVAHIATLTGDAVSAQSQSRGSVGVLSMTVPGAAGLERTTLGGVSELTTTVPPASRVAHLATILLQICSISTSFMQSMHRAVALAQLPVPVSHRHSPQTHHLQQLQRSHATEAMSAVAVC